MDVAVTAQAQPLHHYPSADAIDVTESASDAASIALLLRLGDAIDLHARGRQREALRVIAEVADATIHAEASLPPWVIRHVFDARARVLSALRDDA